MKQKTMTRGQIVNRAGKRALAAVIVLVLAGLFAMHVWYPMIVVGYLAGLTAGWNIGTVFFYPRY